MLATFPVPSNALRAARDLTRSLGGEGVQVRSGIHAGEVEVRGEDISGLAVHVAQRVTAAAEGGQVLVSRTIADLLVGTGLQLVPRGAYDLKGVPGRWELFGLDG